MILSLVKYHRSNLAVPNIFWKIFQDLECLVELCCDPAADVPALHAGEEPEDHLQVLRPLTVHSVLKRSPSKALSSCLLLTCLSMKSPSLVKTATRTSTKRMQVGSCRSARIFTDSMIYSVTSSPKWSSRFFLVISTVCSCVARWDLMVSRSCSVKTHLVKGMVVEIQTLSSWYSLEYLPLLVQAHGQEDQGHLRQVLPATVRDRHICKLDWIHIKASNNFLHKK